MSLEITWPRAHESQSVPKSLVAFGLADESTVGVVGACRSISEPAVPIPCTVVSFMLTEGAGKGAYRYRWSIVVKTPGPGDYVLTVSGLRADGSLDPDPVSVPFRVGQASVSMLAGLGLANVLYPGTNQDITLEASNLTANGDLITYPLALLEFKDSSGNVITPTSLYEDYQFMECWIATYPPLAPGTYSLHVEDANGNGQTATGIYVGP
ncbi:hypothetical protein SAMN05444166_5016 [Singulisphaera sp. GP187]|uniref:hypothetical protein n=1 Tax=Singulisphaera sp. GP187 TaxID=1882752 RepID=UPI0009259F50|nr:hypothetical protein [Singulisphaera sp. GP187]SIO47085.1 hypothetical protein SAMN05444166_5016 [Singulisphaera sp. GP187]